MAARERGSSSGVKTLRAMFENGDGSATDISDGASERVLAHDGEVAKDGVRPVAKVRTAFISVEDGNRASSPERQVVKTNEAVGISGARDKDGEVTVAEAQASLATDVEACHVPASPVPAAKADESENPSQGAAHHAQEKINRPESKSDSKSKLADRLSVPKKRPSVTPSASASPRSLRTSKSKHIGTSSRPKPKAAEDTVRSPTALKAVMTATPASPSFARNTSSNAAKAKTYNTAKSVNKALKTAPALQGTRLTTGFVKPKPRSPTRPVTLPSHLMAATASSAAKRLASSVSHQPQSGERSRRPSTYSTTSSRPSLAHKNHATASSASIARKTSVTFGQPPRAKAGDQQQRRSTASSACPSDSFMSRIMRPTASSANKVNEHMDSAAAPPSRPKVASRAVRAGGVSTPLKSKAKRNSPESTRSGEGSPKIVDTAAKKNSDTNKDIQAHHDDGSDTVQTKSAVVNGEAVHHGSVSADSGMEQIVVASVEALVAPKEPVKSNGNSVD